MRRDALEAETEDRQAGITEGRQAKHFYTTPYKKNLLRDPGQNVCIR
jgi:hypothetical protein